MEQYTLKKKAKSFTAEATQGTSIFNQIASGNVQRVPDAEDVQKAEKAPKAKNAQNTKNADNVQYVQNVDNAENTKNLGGRPAKYEQKMERLNLSIPADVKAYLKAAAYRESSPTRMVSPTEYLISLIRKDMEQHKE